MRRQRPAARPVAPGFFMAAVEAAHGQHHHRGAQLHPSAAGLVDDLRAVQPAALPIQCIDAVAVQQGQPPV
jgi:hypothetical protein